MEIDDIGIDLDGQTDFMRFAESLYRWIDAEAHGSFPSQQCTGS